MPIRTCFRSDVLLSEHNKQAWCKSGWSLDSGGRQSLKNSDCDLVSVVLFLILRTAILHHQGLGTCAAREAKKPWRGLSTEEWQGYSGATPLGLQAQSKASWQRNGRRQFSSRFSNKLIIDNLNNVIRRSWALRHNLFLQIVSVVKTTTDYFVNFSNEIPCFPLLKCHCFDSVALKLERGLHRGSKIMTFAGESLIFRHRNRQAPASNEAVRRLVANKLAVALSCEGKARI